MSTEFGHRPVDEARRRRKARLLAEAAKEMGLADEDLVVGSGLRAAVVAAAGVNKPSFEKTWEIVHEILHSEGAHR